MPAANAISRPVLAVRRRYTPLRLSASEFDELLALLRSRIDVSVHRLLVSQTGG